MIKRNTFWGYERTDGQVGIRNHLLVVSTVHCSAVVAQKIADQAGGVAITHQQGCMQLGEDLEQTKRVLQGVVQNPNCGAVLVVGLGCEQIHAKELAETVKDKPVAYINIHAEGGTPKTIVKGINIAKKMIDTISRQKRIQCSVSKLILAVKCGGSDPTSGLAANPALGVASDLLIGLDGAVVMGTESLYGSEHILAKRAKSPEIAQKILHSFADLERDSLQMGHSFKEANPTPGNKLRGITTMVEKALGAMTKGGTAPISGFLNAGERVTEPGLWIMETRGGDVTGISVQAAGGAQLVVFTTGWGNPVGLPIAPVIKVTGNNSTYKRMLDNLDFDTNDIITREKTVQEVGEELFNKILDIADGELCKAEILGHNEFAIPRIGSAI